jgi:hypothetical protein
MTVQPHNPWPKEEHLFSLTLIAFPLDLQYKKTARKSDPSLPPQPLLAPLLLQCPPLLLTLDDDDQHEPQVCDASTPLEYSSKPCLLLTFFFTVHIFDVFHTSNTALNVHIHSFQTSLSLVWVS